MKKIWFHRFPLLHSMSIARGIFTSVKDLKRKLIRLYDETSRSIKWKYTDVSNRIAVSNSTLTVH